MKTPHIIGIDLAKRVFQLHGADDSGKVLFRKKLTRSAFLDFLAKQSPCTVALEACATSHYWGREIGKFGHEVRLIPLIYVKPFVKRQKNDTADAEAICEAAIRPTMRFVAVKSEEDQADAMVFRTRDLLVQQRTQLINALRAHLAEYGIVAANTPSNLPKLFDALDEADLPDLVFEMSEIYAEQIALCSEKLIALDRVIKDRSKADDEARLLQTMPGVGPITAMAMKAFAPPMEDFKRGKDFSAWLGLVPRQHSTGGKERLGRTSKMGQRDIRRLLIVGAMSVIRSRKNRETITDPWLRNILDRKPVMVAAIALANKMARIIWAMITKQEEYRFPTAVTA